MDVALLILRLIVGLYLAAHGAQKLFGWFNGPGLKGAEGFIGGMLGFRPASFWAPALAIAETGGGLLFVFGFLSPLGALGIIASQLTATMIVHWAKGPFNTEGGYEQTLTNLGVAVAVALAGPGRYSVDRLFGISLPAWVAIVLTILTLLGVVVAIGSRRVTAQQPSANPA